MSRVIVERVGSTDTYGTRDDPKMDVQSGTLIVDTKKQIVYYASGRWSKATEEK